MNIRICLHFVCFLFFSSLLVAQSDYRITQEFKSRHRSFEIAIEYAKTNDELNKINNDMIHRINEYVDHRLAYIDIHESDILKINEDKLAVIHKAMPGVKDDKIERFGFKIFEIKSLSHQIILYTVIMYQLLKYKKVVF